MVVFANLMTLVVDPVFLWSLGSTLIFIMAIAYLFSRPDAKDVTADAGASAAAASSDPPAVEPAKPEKPIRPQKPASSTTRASPLCLHTFKGHPDSIRSIAFSADGKGLATVCGDNVARVFKLDDVASKSFHLVKINLEEIACGIAFADDNNGGDDALVVASEAPSGSTGLFMYPIAKMGGVGPGGKSQPISRAWKADSIHAAGKVVMSFGGSYYSGSREGLVASCTNGTDVVVYAARTGRQVARVDTNQLKNHMSALSPDGKFLAAAAFTADVKIWEMGFKDGAALPAQRVMVLKGHTSGVRSLSFSHDSKRMVTSSEDGTWKVWSLEVRYWLDEDPKCVLTTKFCEGVPAAGYNFVAISPRGGVVAAAAGKAIHFLCLSTGRLLDAVEGAHDRNIAALEFSPTGFLREGVPGPEGGAHPLLATGAGDKTVKLWSIPAAE